MKSIYLISIILLLFSCKSPIKTVLHEEKVILSPPQYFYKKNLDKTSLSGHIKEEKSEDPVIYGSIALYKNDVLITGVETDFDGNYLFSDIDSGIYDLEISYIGHETRIIKGILLLPNVQTILNATIHNQIKLTEVIIINCSFPPIIEQDDFTKGQTFISTDIKRSPISKSN